MSLVYTLASRNLFQDRLRFIASLTGIVFSVVLVMVQLGLYFGFNRMLTMIIDHAPTDLWVVAAETKYFEDLSLLDNKIRERLLAVYGVAEAAPVLAGFSVWMLPEGGMTSVFVVASGALPSWNVVEGDAQSLLEQGTVAMSRRSRRFSPRSPKSETAPFWSSLTIRGYSDWPTGSFTSRTARSRVNSYRYE